MAALSLGICGEKHRAFRNKPMRNPYVVSVFALSLPMIASAQTPASPPPPAAQYVMMAGQSDQFEIQSGELASSKAMSPKIKKFGAEMVTDHTKSTKLVLTAASKSGMPSAPPPGLNSEQAQMLSQLQAQSGADFDKLYVTQQLHAHQEALALQSGYAADGDDPSLKVAASKIVPVVKMHLGMLQNMPSGM